MNGLLSRSADIVRILLIIGIAYTVATTVWHFVSGPTQSVPAQAAAIVRSQQGAAPAGNWQDIAKGNLFGIPGAEPVETKVVKQDTAPAKETRLPLTLLGVFQAEHPEDSAAIVAQKGKSGLRYGIGQTMPGNAELVEVFADHIILRRAGVRETLRFPKSDKMISAVEGDARAATAAPSSPRRAAPTRANPASNPLPETTEQLVAEYRDKLAQDPQGTLNSLGVTPVTSGDSQGYKLGGLASSPYLRNTGLQAGDVLLSVNGQAVGDIQLDQMRMASVLSEGSARLEIMRGKRRFFVTAALK